MIEFVPPKCVPTTRLFPTTDPTCPLRLLQRLARSSLEPRPSYPPRQSPPSSQRRASRSVLDRRDQTSVERASGRPRVRTCNQTKEPLISTLVRDSGCKRARVPFFSVTSTSRCLLRGEREEQREIRQRQPSVGRLQPVLLQTLRIHQARVSTHSSPATKTGVRTLAMENAKPENA